MCIWVGRGLADEGRDEGWDLDRDGFARGSGLGVDHQLGVCKLDAVLVVVAEVGDIPDDQTLVRALAVDYTL
jgi:hypothetical protein